MQTYCDICDQNALDTTAGICDDCWLESAQPGGVHADYRYRVDGDEVETCTLAEFVAVNEEITAEEIRALAWLRPGESYPFGGGAGPLITVTRMED